MEYSDKVMEHFRNPKNIGKIENPDGIGKVGNPTCGDIMELQIKVKNNKIEDIKFQTFGCAAAIASSSMITQLVKGKTLEEAKRLEYKDVIDELKGLPKIKIHCSSMAIQALKKAIEDYEKK
jgi:nitrogen fixation NifU-like protein